MRKETKAGGGQILGKRSLALSEKDEKENTEEYLSKFQWTHLLWQKRKTELKINTVEATGFNFIAFLHIDHNNLAKLSPNLLKE